MRVSFKAPWRSGTAHADMDAHQFLARLCALVPPPGFHGGAAGDPKTIEKTLTAADANLEEVRQEGSQAAKEQLAERVEEVDKGYHSNDVLTKLEEVEVRSYIPEPKRGRRNWKNKDAERDAVRRNLLCGSSAAIRVPFHRTVGRRAAPPNLWQDGGTVGVARAAVAW